MKTFRLAPGIVPENMTLHGVLPDLHRMKGSDAEKVSPAVKDLSKCPAGGRLRFRTDSFSITIEVHFRNTNINCGTDIVCDGSFRGTVCGPDITKDYPSYRGTLLLTDEGHAVPGSKKMRQVTVFLPRTAEVEYMDISLEDYSSVCPEIPYSNTKPVVFYGSSITQGATSLSPSKCYVALVSERLDTDHINLGFGGNAKGERAMAEYIASLDMSAFVLDYEHNADSIEELKERHKPFFDIIRSAHPDLPILMISRPDTDREFLRSCRGRQVILDTFHSALDDGDELVDYIDGFYLWGNDDRDGCTSDGCHPNELGFARMADVVAPRLKALMDRKKADRN